MKTKIIIIDNYDSFTYNIVQRLGELGYNSKVYFNDKITPNIIETQNPSHIIISPGPCTPNESGNSNIIIEKFKNKIPILGVCLGHQCIAQVFGGTVIKNKPIHGKGDKIQHNQKNIFSNIQQNFIAARYHSLIVEKETLPDCLEITATNNEGLIMGIRHKDYKIEGIQFHPESILTTEGHKLLKNFITQ